MPESERSDENGMVILSRVDACAPPYPTMYTGSGDVKQKRRARRPEGEEWSEAGIRNLRQQVKYALRFFVVETALHQNPKQLSLSPPSRTAASASSQAGQSNKTKEIINRREHNTRTHPRRIARQRSEAGRRGSRITPKKHSTTAGGTTLPLRGIIKTPKKTKPDLRKPNILTRQHIKTT